MRHLTAKSGDPKPTLTAQQKEALEYIHAMTGQLSAMAGRHKAHTISYMLGMASIEAGDVLRGARPMNIQIPGNRDNLSDPALLAVAALKIARSRQMG